MNKKLWVFSILAIFMLVVISFASTVTSNTTDTPRRKGYSPLFLIRVRKAINERTEDIKSMYLGERVFFLPFQWIIRYRTTNLPTGETYPSCWTHCNPFFCKE